MVGLVADLEEVHVVESEHETSPEDPALVHDEIYEEWHGFHAEAGVDDSVNIDNHSSSSNSGTASTVGPVFDIHHVLVERLESRRLFWSR